MKPNRCCFFVVLYVCPNLYMQAILYILWRGRFTCRHMTVQTSCQLWSCHSWRRGTLLSIWMPPTPTTAHLQPRYFTKANRGLLKPIPTGNTAFPLRLSPSLLPGYHCLSFQATTASPPRLSLPLLPGYHCLSSQAITASPPMLSLPLLSGYHYLSSQAVIDSSPRLPLLLLSDRYVYFDVWLTACKSNTYIHKYIYLISSLQDWAHRRWQPGNVWLCWE